MKHIRHLALCLLLALSLMTSAFAAEVPEELVVENLNGQQRLVKTYVLSPDVDPDTLKEPPFDYDVSPTPGPIPPRRNSPIWTPRL